MSLMFEREPLDRPALTVLSRGTKPSVALFGKQPLALGFSPAVELAKLQIGTVYPIHGYLDTNTKTNQIDRAGRLVCINAGIKGVALDRTIEVLKLAQGIEVPAYVNVSHPDFAEYAPAVFDGASLEGYELLARHLIDPRQYPVATLTAHLQSNERPYEQPQGE